MKNTQQKLESDDFDALLAEAWPQLSRDTQKRWIAYVTRISTHQFSGKQSWPSSSLAKPHGLLYAGTEPALNELKDRILATAEKKKVLHSLSRSLQEMATGDVRSIEDVIREAKLERLQE